MNRHNVVFIILLLWALLVAAAGPALGAGVTAPGLLGLGASGLILLIALGGRLMNRWLEPLFGSLLVSGLALAALGVVQSDAVMAGLGVVAAIVVGAGAGVSLAIGDAPGDPGRAPGGDRERRAAHIEQMVDKIHEYSMLSDTAKRVLFRERELELLRRVIEDDIRRGDYHAALRLCDDMADLFGYREEAEAYRSRLTETRHSHQETQVHAAMGELDTFLGERNWTGAHDIAARLRRLFPDSHVLELIDGRINRARDEHKHELEKAFVEAAEREDVELAMQRLRELDRYLDRDEAGRLAEYAENVVARHRENLSVQFKLAVNDHRWADAARVGDAIIAEFPNTKMAEEVRSMIDVLRTRATQAALAAED